MVHGFLTLRSPTPRRLQISILSSALSPLNLSFMDSPKQTLGARLKRPLPPGLATALRVMLWVGVALGLLSAWLAWATGMLSNWALVFAMLGCVVLVCSRLIRAVTGGLKFSDWRVPRSREALGPWVHIAARIAFWLALIGVIYLSTPRAVFDAQEWAEMEIIFAVMAVILIGCSLLPKASRRRPMTVFALLGLMFMMVEWGRITAYESPKNAVTLSAPFDGESFVFHGGASALISHHFPHRNQRHALDIVILNADGLSPDLPDYRNDPCYGRTLYAPTDGTVARVISTLDETGPDGTYEQLVGNQIVIDRGADARPANGRYVLLAHLEKDSAQVAEGETVRAGQPIAACGNSGNSSGPHLHIQAQSVVDFDDPNIRTAPIVWTGTTRLRGEAALRADGLTYRRNDIMRATIKAPQ